MSGTPSKDRPSVSIEQECNDFGKGDPMKSPGESLSCLSFFVYFVIWRHILTARSY